MNHRAMFAAVLLALLTVLVWRLLAGYSPSIDKRPYLQKMLIADNEPRLRSDWHGPAVDRRG